MAERLRRSCAATGSGGRARRRRRRRPSCGPRCEAEAARYRRALELLDDARRRPAARRSGGGRGARRRAGCLRRHPRRAAAARHRARAGACRSTPGCARTGAASAGTEGFWLPECAYAPGLERAPGRARPAVLLHRPERPRGRRSTRWRRSATEAGPVALHDRLGGGRAGSGRSDGYPSDPAYAEFDRQIAARDRASGRSAAEPTTRRPRRARGRAPGR